MEWKIFIFIELCFCFLFFKATVRLISLVAFLGTSKSSRPFGSILVVNSGPIGAPLSGPDVEVEDGEFTKRQEVLSEMSTSSP